MKTFSLHLHSITQHEYLENIVSFVGEDRSGKFGIMPSHYRMMTSLKFGLSTITYENSAMEYLALAGGIVYFTHNTLYVSSKNYYRSEDYNEIATTLMAKLRSEAEAIHDINETLNRLDEMVLKRLWEMQQAGRL